LALTGTEMAAPSVAFLGFNVLQKPNSNSFFFDPTLPFKHVKTIKIQNFFVKLHTL
jgi:hypothetical protein